MTKRAIRRGWMSGVIAMVLLGAMAPAAHAAPDQQDVFKSIQNSVGERDTLSGKAVAGIAAVVGGIVIVAVVATHRQNRRATAGRGWGATSAGYGGGGGRSVNGPVNNPGKLVRELMKEAGLTRAQVRQLEALNARLADDDRAVEHLATLLLCPSLITAARAEPVSKAA